MTVFFKKKLFLMIVFDIVFPSRSSNLFSPQLPELPSVLGSRRGSCAASPDIPEPLDLLVKGESQKKSQTEINLDTSEQAPEKAPEEVHTYLLVNCNAGLRNIAVARNTSISVH